MTVGGNTLSCSHYVQLGYTCEVSACRPAPARLRRGTADLLILPRQVLTTTPQFMSQFDCHCSCPGASSAVPKAPGAKQCNTNALAGACGETTRTLPLPVSVAHWLACSGPEHNDGRPPVWFVPPASFFV